MRSTTVLDLSDSESESRERPRHLEPDVAQIRALGVLAREKASQTDRGGRRNLGYYYSPPAPPAPGPAPPFHDLSTFFLEEVTVEHSRCGSLPSWREIRSELACWRHANPPTPPYPGALTRVAGQCSVL